MSLASRLPYSHAHAGGFPGIGSQPLPTDSDCLTYLAAVAAADGAGVETGVAVSVDTFLKDIKAAGLFDAIKASCILCGARTLEGALVPLAGTAPTSNGFVSGDYSRTAGLTGDGTSYLDSNRPNNADPQDSKHLAVYATTATSAFGTYAGSFVYTLMYRAGTGDLLTRVNRGSPFTAVPGAASATGLIAANRPSFSTTQARAGGTTITESQDAQNHISDNAGIFAQIYTGSASVISDATIAFYSIGTSLDLEALDTAVNNLITDIGNAL